MSHPLISLPTFRFFYCNVLLAPELKVVCRDLVGEFGRQYDTCTLYRYKSDHLKMAYLLQIVWL